MWRLFSFLFALFGRRVAAGNLYLVIDGKKQIEVKPGFDPKEVWIRPMQPCGVPVCMGGVDSFDVRIVPNGFVIIAEMSSEYRELQWIAIR
jgi:hypothetical protein